MQQSTATPSRPERASSLSHENAALWGAAPVLKNRASGFAGRVFVEVWASGNIQLVASNPKLLQPALVALQSSVPIHDTAMAIPKSSITGPNSGTDFLGRVIVEFWPDGPIVAVIGSNEPVLLERASKRLTEALLAT